MKDTVTTFKLVFATIGGYIGWFLGGYDGFLYALVIFVILDYITGVMLAILESRVSSEIGARGIFKKMLVFALVGTAHIIDSHIAGDGSVVRTAVIFFYLSNEGISILENASGIGLPIPAKLKNILEGLGKGDGEDGQNMP
ncbi:conserved hypothetical protein [anaerobic digester metagenome]|uniref:Holin family protein n=1 Tax=anaerobic digester metagenome TaxID=1263854 RepID=A0A485LV76_9ZZZZ